MGVVRRTNFKIKSISSFLFEALRFPTNLCVCVCVCVICFAQKYALFCLFSEKSHSSFIVIVDYFLTSIGTQFAELTLVWETKINFHQKCLSVVYITCTVESQCNEPLI